MAGQPEIRVISLSNTNDSDHFLVAYRLIPPPGPHFPKVVSGFAHGSMESALDPGVARAQIETLEIETR